MSVRSPSSSRGVRRQLAALAAGLLFAVGLGISGMTRPPAVLGFLDVAGAWNPSLAFVMAGAVGIHAVLRRVRAARPSAQGRPAPLLDDRFHDPVDAGIDAPLVIGALLFGVGWGIAGFCPGPALVALGGGVADAWIFTAAMLIGVVVHHATVGRARG